MDTQTRIERYGEVMAVVSDPTSSFEAEQEVLAGHPGVDIARDLPGDRAYRLRSHDMDASDLDAFNVLCSESLGSGLYERGLRTWYVPVERIDDLQRGLEGLGFVVARGLGVAQ